MSGFYRYDRLTRIASQYSVRMDRLRCRIFGEAPPSISRGERRVARLFAEPPRYKLPEYVDYYPRLLETYRIMVRLRQLGLYRDEHEDFKEEMKRQRALRGKGPKHHVRKTKKE